MAATVVLLHSPLTTAAVWGEVPDLLRDAGRDVVVVEVDDDRVPPYAMRYVAAAAQSLQRTVGSGPCVLVGHSGAGPLLPQIGFARHSVRAAVDGYLFLDAMLPRVPGATTRLELMRLADEQSAGRLHSALAAGARFPDWTDSALAADLPDPTARQTVLHAVRPRGLDFFTEPLPQPEDWPDAPVTYVRLSNAYDAAATVAERRGWFVQSLKLHHFAMLTDPETVARCLAAALAET